MVVLNIVVSIQNGNSVKSYYCDDWKSFCNAIKEQRPHILTTVTKAIDSKVMEYGYNICVQSGEKVIDFMEILLGAETTREIRTTHNWEKLVFNGEFDLEIFRFLN